MLAVLRTRSHLVILALSLAALAVLAFDAATALHVFSAGWTVSHPDGTELAYIGGCWGGGAVMVP